MTEINVQSFYEGIQQERHQAGSYKKHYGLSKTMIFNLIHDQFYFQDGQEKQAYTAYTRIWFRNCASRRKHLQKLAVLKTGAADRIFKLIVQNFSKSNLFHLFQQQHQILHGYATAVWDSPPATDKDKLLNPTHLISGHIRIWHAMYLPLCI